MKKSNANRSLLEPKNAHLSLCSHVNSKFLSSATCPPTSSNNFDYNGDSYLFATTFSFNKLSTYDTDHDNHNQLLLDDLHSSLKDDLIKFVIAL